MRRFFLSGSMLSALFSGWGTVQATRKGPRDWRLLLMWIVWGLTLAIAVGTVVKDTQQLED